MNRCPISYEDCGRARYAPAGLHLLSRRLTTLKDFPYSASEQRREAILRAGKISIQGVQPKLSARLSLAREVLPAAMLPATTTKYLAISPLPCF